MNAYSRWLLAFAEPHNDPVIGTLAVTIAFCLAPPPPGPRAESLAVRAARLCPAGRKLLVARPVPSGGRPEFVLVCAAVLPKADDLWIGYKVVDVAFADYAARSLKLTTPWSQASRERDGSLSTNEVTIRLVDLDGDGKPEVSVLCMSYGGQSMPTRVWVAKRMGGKWRGVGVEDSEYPFDLTRGPNGTRAWKGSYRIGGRSRRHNRETWVDYYSVVRGRLPPVPQRFRNVYREIPRRLSQAVRDDPDAELWLHLAKARRLSRQKSNARRAALEALRLARQERLDSFKRQHSDDEQSL